MAAANENRDPGAQAPRVLWITRRAPGPQPAGADTYSMGLLQALAGAGAAVTALGLREPADGHAEVRPGAGQVGWHAVAAGERSSVRALASVLPLVAARASPPPIVAALRRALAEQAFDAVVFDNYAAGWALDLARDLPERRPHLIYVAHNDETRLAADIAAAFSGDPLRKLALRLNAAKIRRLERRLVRDADLVVTLTDRDREQFSARSPGLRGLVLPPGYSGQRQKVRRISSETPRRVVMLGSVRWIAKRMNVAAFLAEADARLAAAGITLDIIGDVPDDFRAEWEPRVSATRFRGFVDDLASELRSSRIGLVVEPSGGGFKLKVLDYVFHRVPVAALAGSAQGLPRAVSASFLEAADMPGLVGEIIRAIDDPDELNARHEAAFSAAEGAFDWAENGRRFLAEISALEGMRARPETALAERGPLLPARSAVRGV